MVLEKTLETPLDCEEIKQFLKEINPEYSLEGLMLKLKLQHFGHLMWRTGSLEKTLMLEDAEGRRRRGWQRTRWLDSITDPMNMNLSKLKEKVKDREACGITESPHNLETKQQQQPVCLILHHSVPKAICSSHNVTFMPSHLYLTCMPVPFRLCSYCSICLGSLFLNVFTLLTSDHPSKSRADVSFSLRPVCSVPSTQN